MAGIWDNPLLGKFNELPKELKLSLGEGNTPLELVELPGRMALAVKDENKNPNGSFKDRSLAYQMSMYIDRGQRRFALSSSGNAAVSAAAFAEIAAVELDLFVSPLINPLKWQKIQKFVSGSANIHVHQSLHAKSDATQLVMQDKNIVNLRGSLDDLALPGFKTIAYELAEQYPEIDALFVPCSSGTSALAIMQGFKELGKKVAVYICQTEKVHAIAAELDPSYSESDTSLADAIGDRVAHRKDEVISALHECGGGGKVISDTALLTVRHELSKAGFDYSFNSLLAFAGYFKLADNNYRHTVILASGL